MRYLIPTARPIVQDLAGTVAFYLLVLLTGSARLAAAAGLALGLAQIARHRWRGERVPTLLAMGVALTLVLGCLTLLTNDPRFVLLKPSIIYAAIGATMLPRGWVRRYVPGPALELLPARTFDRVGWGWAALLLATAVLNLALVATLAPIRAAAVLLGWSVASKFALFAAQYATLRARAFRAAAGKEATKSL